MKIDLHVHTCEMSLCGVLSTEETVDAYAQSGFDGIVITNHFNSWTQKKLGFVSGGYYDAYRKCFENARRLGEKAGLSVYFGCELKTDLSNNDYLVYGAPDEVLSRTAELWGMSASDVKKLADEYGFLIYQAHPFRDHMQVTPPGNLSGIEIRNANPRHDSRNDIAAEWAKKFSLPGIAGSDCHQSEDVALAGIETDFFVPDTAALVDVLKSGKYRII